MKYRDTFIECELALGLRARRTLPVQRHHHGIAAAQYFQIAIEPAFVRADTLIKPRISVWANAGRAEFPNLKRQGFGAPDIVFNFPGVAAPKRPSDINKFHGLLISVLRGRITPLALHERMAAEERV